MKWYEGVVCLIVIGTVGYLFRPVFTDDGLDRKRESCWNNVRMMGMDYLLYAADSDDRLPPSNGWMDKLNPYVGREPIFRCPEMSAQMEGYGYGYAYNSDVAGRKQATIPKPETVPMIFETNALEKSAVAIFESGLASRPRHHGSNVIGYTDGHVKLVRKR